MKRSCELWGLIFGTLCLLCAIMNCREREISDLPVNMGCIVPPPTVARPLFPTDTTALMQPYQSPIDFDSLQKVNGDIYAWLEMPGTEISYPIVQRAHDHAFYLTHDSNGQQSKSGALFTEDYNALDFEDPVTIIYGHKMKSGHLFGTLQKYYADSLFFEEHKEFYIYLPDRKLNYRVFAAVPYSGKHILYYYDFKNMGMFHSFFESIYATRSLNGILDTEVQLSASDRIVILSTCLRGDNTKRFLVIAVRQ